MLRGRVDPAPAGSWVTVQRWSGTRWVARFDVPVRRRRDATPRGCGSAGCTACASRASRARPCACADAQVPRVDARELLGHADRLQRALALERELHRDLRAAEHVLDADERGAHPHAVADRQRRREADLVQAVVDREREALEGDDLLGEAGVQRERVVAVGDRAAERRLRRALGSVWIHWSSPVTAAKRSTSVLRDRVPVADAELLAHVRAHLVQAVDREHARQLSVRPRAGTAAGARPH